MGLLKAIRSKALALKRLTAIRYRKFSRIYLNFAFNEFSMPQKHLVRVNYIEKVSAICSQMFNPKICFIDSIKPSTAAK